MLVRPSAQPCVFCSFRAAASQDSALWTSANKDRRRQLGGVRTVYHRSKIRHVDKKGGASSTDELKSTSAYVQSPVTEYGRLRFYPLDFSEVLGPIVRQKERVDSRTWEVPKQAFVPHEPVKDVPGQGLVPMDKILDDEEQFRMRKEQHRELFRSIEQIGKNMRDSPDAPSFRGFYLKHLRTNTDITADTRYKAIKLLLYHAMYNSDIPESDAGQVWKVYEAMRGISTAGNRFATPHELDLRYWNRAVLSLLDRWSSPAQIVRHLKGAPALEYLIKSYKAGGNPIQAVQAAYLASALLHPENTQSGRTSQDWYTIDSHLSAFSQLVFDPTLDRTTRILEVMYPLFFSSIRARNPKSKDLYDVHNAKNIRSALQPLLTNASITPNLIKILLQHATTLAEVHKIQLLVAKSSHKLEIIERVNHHFLSTISRVWAHHTKKPIREDRQNLVVELNSMFSWLKRQGMTNPSATTIQHMSSELADQGAYIALRGLLTTRSARPRKLNFAQVTAACLTMPSRQSVDEYKYPRHLQQQQPSTEQEERRQQLRQQFRQDEPSNQTARIVRDFFVPGISEELQTGKGATDNLLVALAGVSRSCGDWATLWEVYKRVLSSSKAAPKSSTVASIISGLVGTGNVDLATALFRTSAQAPTPQIIAAILPPATGKRRLLNAGFPLGEMIRLAIDRGIEWKYVMENRQEFPEGPRRVPKWTYNAWGEEVGKCIDQTKSERADGVDESVLAKVEEVLSGCSI